MNSGCASSSKDKRRSPGSRGFGCTRLATCWERMPTSTSTLRPACSGELPLERGPRMGRGSGSRWAARTTSSSASTSWGRRTSRGMGGCSSTFGARRSATAARSASRRSLRARVGSMASGVTSSASRAFTFVLFLGGLVPARHDSGALNSAQGKFMWLSPFANDSLFRGVGKSGSSPRIPRRRPVADGGPPD